MASEWTERLGFYRGRVYYLAVRVTPGLHNIRDFAAVLYYSPENDPERKVQIARIDTAHGYTHFDHLYRRDRPKERLNVDVWEAAAILEQNWRTYAESFDELNRV